MKTNNLMQEKKTDFLIFILATLFIIIGFYFHSLYRPWQPFDERLFYSEELFPFPTSFNEIFEIIKYFVFNSHIVSYNPFFSNNETLRSDPFAWSILVFLFYLFKDNAFYYHLFQLSIHLMNTVLVWLIFYKVSLILLNKTINKKILLIISIFCLIWSLHSASTEAVLLVTNWNALLLYSFCFYILLIEVSKIEKQDFNFSPKEILIKNALFLTSLLLAEFAYTLPLILFFLSFSYSSYKQSFKQSINYAVKSFASYLPGLTIFAILLLLNPNSNLCNISKNFRSDFLFERVFWLSPQIFFHFLKLLIFPLKLSTYQSNLLNLSDHLISIKTICCTLLFILLLIIPLILSFLKKGNSLLIIYALFFSMFPFLHIITPTYCLIADRYCYFPLLFLLLILLGIICKMFKSKRSLNASFIFLIFILVCLSIRTAIRISEWDNPEKLFKSAIAAEKNPLFKSYKLLVLSNYYALQKNQEKKKKEEGIQEGLSLSNNMIKVLKKKLAALPSEPKTLKQYGLDLESLLLKSAYISATIKNEYLKEDPAITLSFYKPYIRNLERANINEISLYASLLFQSNNKEKAKLILEDALKRFPFSIELILSLSNFYIYEKDINKLDHILNKGLKLFPNDISLLNNLLQCSFIKGDLEKQAYFSYLVGLRSHSIQHYKNAAILYKELNNSVKSNLALKKIDMINRIRN